MARGKLVIASSGVMSAIDLIEDGYNGFIYDSKNPNELNKILINLLNDKDDIYSIGNNALNGNFSDFDNYARTVREALL